MWISILPPLLADQGGAGLDYLGSLALPVSTNHIYSAPAGSCLMQERSGTRQPPCLGGVPDRAGGLINNDEKIMEGERPYYATKPFGAESMDRSPRQMSKAQVAKLRWVRLWRDGWIHVRDGLIGSMDASMRAIRLCLY